VADCTAVDDVDIRLTSSHHAVDCLREGDLRKFGAGREVEAAMAQAHRGLAAHDSAGAFHAFRQDVEPTAVAPVVDHVVDPLPAVLDVGALEETLDELLRGSFGLGDEDEQVWHLLALELVRTQGTDGLFDRVVASDHIHQHFRHLGVEGIERRGVEDEPGIVLQLVVTDGAGDSLAVDQPADPAHSVGADLVAAALAASVAFGHAAVVAGVRDTRQGSVGVELAHSIPHYSRFFAPKSEQVASQIGRRRIVAKKPCFVKAFCLC